MSELWTQGATAIAAIGVAYALLQRMRNDLCKELGQVREQTKASVVQSNGTPIAMIESSPHAEWAKGVDGRMKFINFAYEQTFNIRRGDYVGRLDIEVWPREIALVFAAHDAEVLRQQRLIEFIETVPANRLDQGSMPRRLYVQKYPIWNSGRSEIIAIGGRCWDYDQLSDLVKRAEMASFQSGGTVGSARIDGLDPRPPTDD